jgi:hypothetical protein
VSRACLKRRENGEKQSEEYDNGTKRSFHEKHGKV